MIRGSETPTLPKPLPEPTASPPLEAFLLPLLRWEDALRIQQRLVYEMGEPPRRRGCFIVAEHPPTITIGRQGHADDVLDDDPPVPRHWTNRGGGAWRHGPGQLAIYPTVALEPHPGAVTAFRDALYGALLDVLADFQVAGERDREHGGITVGGRQIAAVGIAVRGWMTFHGCVLNVSMPDDELASVRATPGRPERRQTCQLRERVLPIRPQTLRETAARRFAERLGFAQCLLVPPPLPLRPPRNARRHAVVR